MTHLPPIDEVFNADYRYSSSTVPGLVRHFAEYAGWLQNRVPSEARVLEFGCNDGVLLSQLTDKGLHCVGIDASDNVASLARARGLDVRTGFFTPELVREQGLQEAFDLVTCSNVFAHIHNVRATVRATRDALASGGHFCVEVHNGSSIFGENQFDTIYHEHLTYYTEQTLGDLLRRAGFEVLEVVRTAMHGDGLRLRGRRINGGGLAAVSNTPPVDTAASSLQIKRAIARCADAVRRLRSEYGALHAYGAAGRSQMFLNFTGVGDCFEAVFDDSPLRQGRFIAGTDIPIVAYSGQKGRCCVILAWNYAADIARKLCGRFEHVVTLLPSETHW